MKRLLAAALIPLLLTGCAERVTRLPELSFLHSGDTPIETGTTPSETTAPVFQPDTGNPIVLETVPELPPQDLYISLINNVIFLHSGPLFFLLLNGKRQCHL